MIIRGIEGLSRGEIGKEIDDGGKFVMFRYCISICILTIRLKSDVYFVRAGESAAKHGMVYTVISSVFGWWGFPMGPIWTIWSIAENSSGGIDVTEQAMIYLGL